MEVVFVTWSIRPDAVDEFLADVPSLPEDTPGLIREELHRVIETAPDVVHFVRVGRWASREHFYQALAHTGAAPFTIPPRKAYEVADRRREWLALVREDRPLADS